MPGRTNQSLLTELERCFSGVFGFLLLLGAGGAFRGGGRLLQTIGTMGGLLFVLYFSLRFFRIVRELKRRDTNQVSNRTPDASRQPADDSLKPSL